MKKHNRTEKAPRRVDRESERKNYAKERLKTRLKTLRRKIFRLEKKAQSNKKFRMASLEKLIQEYNETLELIYGKGASVLPNYRLKNRTVEVFVPSIEAKSRGSSTRKKAGLQKKAPVEDIPTPQVIYADDAMLDPAGFDSFRDIDELTADIELLETIQDRMENPEHYPTYVVQADANVRAGEMLFVVQDMYGNVEFAVTIGLTDSVDGSTRSYAPFIKDLAVDLFERGYECTFFVSEFDLENGLVTPDFFDDDSNPYYDGGDDYGDYDDDLPPFSFS